MKRGDAFLRLTLAHPELPLDILPAWLLSRGDSVMLTRAHQSRQSFRGQRVNDLSIQQAGKVCVWEIPRQAQYQSSAWNGRGNPYKVPEDVHELHLST